MAKNPDVINYDDTTAKIVARIEELLLDNSINYYPVYQIPISKFNGIEITGNFSTTASSSAGSVSYVTVGKQHNYASVTDGLGFAWMRSNKLVDVFDNEHMLSDTYSYNCFIVDSSILNSDTFTTWNNLYTEGGFNNALVYGRRVIGPNTTYSFKMRITSNYEVTVWILDDGQDLDLVVDTPYNMDPVTGESTNPYGYILKKGSSDPIYSPNAQGTDFGISVLNTNNYEWYYSDLTIKSITNDYIVSRFRLDADSTYISDGEEFNVLWKGWGQWDEGEVGERGASLYIRNVTTGLWELVGSNTASNSSTNAQKTISKAFSDIYEYRDDNEYVNLIALNPTADNTAEINTAYVCLDNILPSGIHTGGMVDIYVNDPDNILTETVEIVVPAGGSFPLSVANGFKLPVHSITSINSSVTGTQYVENEDYTVVVSEPKNAWSTSTSLSLSFTNAPLIALVTYRYYSRGSTLQSFIESEDYRNPGVSPLIKINAPVIITFEQLDYRGTTGIDTIKELLMDWINDLVDPMELSDIINLLYDNGITYINLNTLNITYKSYSYTGDVLVNDGDLTDTYTLSGLQSFYTDKLEMYGINKLG